ncbi:MAG: sigma-70 family RNA polymerase sigma factor [bacterium]|nr:sigma-70 family RNA polymerase sigma factor [bacterium]
MTEAVEHLLLRQAQQGSYDAFTELHDLLEPGVKRFVGRLIGHGQEAEDITQDTLIALYTNLCRIDPVENLRPYVFRIARNRCYDVLRRQGRFEDVSLDDEPAEMRVSFSNSHLIAAPEDVTHWLLLHLEVQEAMERLPELQRQTLVFYCEEELSYAEIAEIMNVSIGTVKSRLFHARTTLRGLLRPDTLRAIGDSLY